MASSRSGAARRKSGAGIIRLPTDQEFQVMRALARLKPGTSGLGIGRSAGLPHRGIHVTLARLEHKGYVRRTKIGWELSARGQAAVKALG